MSDTDADHSMLAIATAFANDDDDDIAAAALDLQHLFYTVVNASEASESNPLPGSYSGKAASKKRDFLLSETSHLLDYFWFEEAAAHL